MKTYKVYLYVEYKIYFSRIYCPKKMLIYIFTFKEILKIYTSNVYVVLFLEKVNAIVSSFGETPIHIICIIYKKTTSRSSQMHVCTNLFPYMVVDALNNDYRKINCSLIESIFISALLMTIYIILKKSVWPSFCENKIWNTTESLFQLSEDNLIVSILERILTAWIKNTITLFL